MDIDSDMAVSINWRFLQKGFFGALLKTVPRPPFKEELHLDPDLPKALMSGS